MADVSYTFFTSLFYFVLSSVFLHFLFLFIFFVFFSSFTPFLLFLLILFFDDFCLLFSLLYFLLFSLFFFFLSFSPFSLLFFIFCSFFCSIFLYFLFSFFSLLSFLFFPFFVITLFLPCSLFSQLSYFSPLSLLLWGPFSLVFWYLAVLPLRLISLVIKQLPMYMFPSSFFSLLFSPHFSLCCPLRLGSLLVKSLPCYIFLFCLYIQVLSSLHHFYLCILFTCPFFSSLSVIPLINAALLFPPLLIFA